MEGVAARTLLQAASNQAGDTTGKRGSEVFDGQGALHARMFGLWYELK